MANKEFCGSVKLKEASFNGSSWKFHQVSFTMEDLEKMKGFFNDKGFVNLKISKSQKSGGYYMEIDLYGLPPAGTTPPQEEAPATNEAPEPPEFEEEEKFD